MITKYDLRIDALMSVLAKKDNKELIIEVDVIGGNIQYKVYDHSDNKVSPFIGKEALDRALEVLNRLEPMTKEEYIEYKQYLKLKEKYKNYEGLYQD